MSERKPEQPKKPWRLLSHAEFSRLSTEAKIAYLSEAVQTPGIRVKVLPPKESDEKD